MQWEVNTGSGFTALTNGGVYSGVTTDTLTITGATAAMNGYQYEAVFTNGAARSTTNPATLTVEIAPSSDHEADRPDGRGGQQRQLHGHGQRQPHAHRAVGGQHRQRLHRLTNGGVYSGATTGTLTITGATAAMNGYTYRGRLHQQPRLR